MLFVALGKVRSGTMRERTARRLQWQYPEGLRMVAEYWLQTPDPQIISVCEADSIGPIIAAVAQWDDVIDWSVFPAITAQEGMEMARRMAPA